MAAVRGATPRARPTVDDVDPVGRPSRAAKLACGESGFVASICRVTNPAYENATIL
jgi:hypothetical protein